LRGSIRHRGDERAGSWEYIVDIGLAAAQRCTLCSKRVWIERRPKERCAKCGGALKETEERRRETKAGFSTRKECQAAMNKLLVSVEAHNYAAPTKANVRQYLTKEWLPAVKATIRPSTYNSYVQHVECHIVPHIGSTAQEGRRHQGEMRTWTKEQLRAFLDAVADDRLAALWHTIAFTGMRRGEAIGLRWSDVDLENGRLSVRRALIPTNREVVVSESKTVKGRRVVVLDPVTIEVLESQAARQLDEQNEWDEGWVETGLVFTAGNGSALDPESISRYWRQAVKKSMLPPIRLHDLRHTHATLALQAGIHPKVVSERFGHATVSITLDTYSHAIPAMQEEAAALIAGLVFAAE
jgi:integrase